MISDADKRRFHEQGYLVVEGLVPESLCAAARDTIARYLDVNDADSSTWYRRSVQAHGIIPLHHPQAFWDVRQYPPIHQVFAALYGTGKLWVSIDRASFKPPSRGGRGEYRVDPIHWDGDPRRRDVSIQGLIYLADTAPDQGGFCCVPDLYRQLDAWLECHETTTRRPDVGELPVVRIGAPAGSLILWNRRMPHSSAENRGDLPRWVQYVAMEPAGDDEARSELATLYQEKRPPAWAVRQQIAEQQIPEPGEPAVLSDLGRKLTGLVPW
jgi:hypothetical protein